MIYLFLKVSRFKNRIMAESTIQSLNEIKDEIAKTLPTQGNVLELATNLSKDIFKELQSNEIPESVNDICEILVPSIVMLIYTQLTKTNFHLNLTDSGISTYGLSHDDKVQTSTQSALSASTTQSAQSSPVGDVTCQSMTRLNVQCKRPHITGSAYCKQHEKMQSPTAKVCGVQTKVKSPCRNIAQEKYGGRCFAHKE